MRRAFNLLRNVIRRGRYEQELDAELRATLDLLVDEQRTRGVDSSAAIVRARRQLGSVAAIKNRVDDVKAGALLDAFLKDVRFGARLLRRNPVFTVTAALSLAIGIGAATTIFTSPMACCCAPRPA